MSLATRCASSLRRAVPRGRNGQLLNSAGRRLASARSSRLKSPKRLASRSKPTARRPLRTSSCTSGGRR
eukprot:9089522-Alexandrium_andersonii.AAC.1